MKRAWQLEREKLLQYISPILQFLRCVSAKSLFLPAGRQIPISLSFFFFSSPHLRRRPRRPRPRPFGPWRRGRLHRPPARKVSQSN